MLVHCVQRRDQQWLWIVIFLGPLGAVVYFLSVRPPLIPPQLMSLITGRPTTEGQIKEIKAKIRRSPDAILYLELGRLYIEARKVDEAVEALQKSLELESDNPAAHLFMGKALVEQKKYKEALTHLSAAENTREKDHLIEGCRLTAICYEKLGEEKTAMEHYDKLIRAYPFSEARYAYGILLEKHNRLEEAKSQMQAIIHEAEDLPDFSLKKERVWVGRAKRFLVRHR